MITIVLMEPENPGNLGAIARSIKNFGFNKLTLINPKFSKNEPEARNRAKHAQNILDNAKITGEEALEEFDYLIGTTAKLGNDYNIPRVPITPQELAHQIDTKKNIGLLIGREGEGLHNEEILKCDFIVSIPASKEYPTMNISHATTIILYELHKTIANEKTGDDINSIGKAEKEQIMKMLNEAMSKMQFQTEDDKETQRRVWKRMIGKSFMSKREAYALMGFLRKLI